MTVSPIPKEVTHRDHVVADAELVGVVESECCEIARLDLRHRDVRARVGADDARLELTLVSQRDEDLLRVADHMMIGEDVAARRVDDDARSCRLLAPAGAGPED